MSTDNWNSAPDEDPIPIPPPVPGYTPAPDQEAATPSLEPPQPLGGLTLPEDPAPAAPQFSPTPETPTPTYPTVPAPEYGQPIPGYGQSGAAPTPVPGYGQIPPASPMPTFTPDSYSPSPYTAETFSSQLADWPKRALGWLVDYLPALVIMWIGNIIFDGGFGYFLFLAAGVAYMIYDQGVVGGTTGVTWGRKIAGTKLVREDTMQPLGTTPAILRWLCHFLDSVICFVGWIMPLFTPKKQTLADMVMKTVVIDTTK